MIYKTKFDDLIILKKKSYKDKRGYFKELLIEKEVKQKFPFVVMSFSRKNVIRGTLFKHARIKLYIPTSYIL